MRWLFKTRFLAYCCNVRVSTPSFVFAFGFEKNVTGELLLISGQSVFIGYLNANNDSFTTNKEDVRYMATGDMIYQKDNKFFSGRQDNTIKYNGHRIDLGEINHVIEQLSSISNVRTLPLEHNGRVICLVAFIQTSDCNAGVINAYLEPRLSKCMISSEYVFHVIFSLTHNLKIDNQQLLKQYMDF